MSAEERRQQPARARLANYISRRVQEGAFRAIDPRLAARTFIGSLAYHGMQSLLFQDDFVPGTPSDAIESMTDIFLRGVSRMPRGE